MGAGFPPRPVDLIIEEIAFLEKYAIIIHETRVITNLGFLGSPISFSYGKKIQPHFNVKQG